MIFHCFSKTVSGRHAVGFWLQLQLCPMGLTLSSMGGIQQMLLIQWNQLFLLHNQLNWVGTFLQWIYPLDLAVVVCKP